MHVVAQLIRAAEGVHLVRINVIRLAAAGDLALAIADQNHRGVAVRVGLNAIFAGGINGEGEIRSIDFVGVIRIVAPDVNFNSALGELDLNRAVIEIQNGDTGLTPETDGGAANVQFAARIFVGPEIVSGGEWTIGIRGNPFLLIVTAGLVGNRALNEIEASYAGRRIILSGSRA